MHFSATKKSSSKTTKLLQFIAPWFVTCGHENMQVELSIMCPNSLDVSSALYVIEQ